MKIAKIAYASLYDDVEENNFELSYSGKFSAYNANVMYTPRSKTYTFSVSKSWRGVSEDILVGLLQHLILKVKKEKRRTINIDLYENFLRNVHQYIKKTKTDPVLELCFADMNDTYFNGRIEPCNLKWGQESIRTLGHYAYGSDTITISKLFQNIDPEDQPYLDLVMYHEMLHKKHKFESGTKTRYHTPAFRAEERQFKNFEYYEKNMSKFIAKQQRKIQTLSSTSITIPPQSTKRKKSWFSFD